MLSLRRLIDDGHEIVAVWTQPDRPAGRGNKMHQSPVKEFAVQHNLTVHQPLKIKTQEAKSLFASHGADAAVVVAYGRILPPEFLSAPSQGCINVHFSLLQVSGAAPVNWGFIEGEKQKGVHEQIGRAEPVRSFCNARRIFETRNEPELCSGGSAGGIFSVTPKGLRRWPQPPRQ